MYYAAVCLHPYYKYYCEKSWRDKAGWLEANNSALQLLWAQYKLQVAAISRRREPTLSSIDDAINALGGQDDGGEVNNDEYDNWRKYEPK